MALLLTTIKRVIEEILNFGNLARRFAMKSSITIVTIAVVVVSLGLGGCSSNDDPKPVDTSVPDTSASDSFEPQWHDEQGYRWAQLEVAQGGKTGFSQLGSEDTGIAFANQLAAEHAMENQIRMNGSGVAAGDFDNDGLVDLYFCGLSIGNKLFRNLGQWKFAEVTDNSQLACQGQFCTGATFADVDGDGHLDLLVTALGSTNHCFLNDGKGNFTDATVELGLDCELGSTTLALADIEGDGDLDLYLCNYRTDTIRDLETRLDLTLDKDGQPTGQWKNRIRVVDGGTQELGEADVLYLNDGGLLFRPVPFNSENFLDEYGAPAGTPYDWSNTARFHDVDRDGDQDLYVCSDFGSPDRLWINDGKGDFRVAPRLAMRNMSNFSMSVALADIDRDGHEDFFVSDMLSRRHDLRKRQMGDMKPTPLTIGMIDDRPQFMRNTMFHNRGDETFAEIAQFAGVDKSDWTWTTLFLDVDLDGYEDLVATTGHAYDVQDADISTEIKAMGKLTLKERLRNLVKYPQLNVRNYIFRNDGHLHFREMGEKWGFTQECITHGMATADLDNDGDLDLAANNLYSSAGIYRNDCSEQRIAVRLRGQGLNTRGIGARLELVGGSLVQNLEVHAGGLYLSGSDTQLVFAAPTDTVESNGFTLHVWWPSGQLSTLHNVQANRLYEVWESGSIESQTSDFTTSLGPALFEDVSNALEHHHFEAPFDDFATQSLLPNRLSQLGPGVAWFDFDNDGDDDLVISSGRGGSLAYYRNQDGSRFELAPGGAKLGSLELDLTTPLGFSVSEKNICVIGTSSFEGDQDVANVFETLDLASIDRFVPLGGYKAQGSCTGPLAAADVDGDGDLDLLVGGRNIRAAYPLPASSRLMLNQSGSFEEDPTNHSVLNRIGMVSGAVFSDVDGDGDPDLILALEWGPITVLRNEGGKLTDVTADLGLSDLTGWWNGVTTGDLDGDGHLDIVAVNWGENSKYHTSSDQPILVYANDFDQSGSLDVVEAHFDPLMKCLVPERGLSCSSNAMPFIRKQLPTFAKFGGAQLQEIYGEQLLENAYRREVTTLSHTVFLNRGDHFVPVEFPQYAQVAPGFGVNVADFNGDGHQDVFMAQNFFATQIETNRLDAGRGLLLLGNGSGSLVPLRGQESGIRVYGEQRGSAVSDFNGDGRPDLVVTQNGNRTRLFRNVNGKPGIRVRLVGDTGNPHAVGATIRLQFRSELGPACEIHVGSGYWSQDSSILVLAHAKDADGIWVRWPGGEETTSVLPSNARAVEISADGTLRVVR